MDLEVALDLVVALLGYVQHRLTEAPGLGCETVGHTVDNSPSNLSTNLVETRSVLVNSIANTFKKLEDRPHTLVNDLRTIPSNSIKEVEDDVGGSVNDLANIVRNSVQEVCQDSSALLTELIGVVSQLGEHCLNQDEQRCHNAWNVGVDSIDNCPKQCRHSNCKLRSLRTQGDDEVSDSICEINRYLG